MSKSFAEQMAALNLVDPKAARQHDDQTRQELLRTEQSQADKLAPNDDLHEELAKTPNASAWRLCAIRILHRTPDAIGELTRLLHERRDSANDPDEWQDLIPEFVGAKNCILSARQGEERAQAIREFFPMSRRSKNRK